MTKPTRASTRPQPKAAPPRPEPAPEGGAGQRALRAAGQLLDAQKSLLNKGLRALTPLPAFEDVFDQRVAAALKRLGLPDPQELARLREQVQDLQRRVDALAPKPRGRPPR
ncbi:MAG: phasin family protein [Burkholderiales bacterium]|nr:phasin family protein [Burkholderiales bacterium]MDE2453236.1 phasin family protein [Burkholderiales bacterium]